MHTFQTKLVHISTLGIATTTILEIFILNFTCTSFCHNFCSLEEAQNTVDMIAKQLVISNLSCLCCEDIKMDTMDDVFHDHG